MLSSQQFGQLNAEFNAIFDEILPDQQFGLNLFPIQDDELISQVSIDIDDFPILGHGSGYQSIFVIGLKLMRTLSQLLLTEGMDVRNFILAIEEPEAHLHPHMQRHLMNSLRRLQRLWGEKGYRLQIMITTHSPSIVSRGSLHELIVFRRELNQTNAIKWRKNELQAIAEELEPDESKRGKKYNQLRNWSEFFQERNADVFFSNCVIVVEGETEEGAIPVWAGKLDPPVDFDQLGISFVNGKGDSITYALKILDRFGVDHACLYDQSDEHYVVGVSRGGVYATYGNEFEDDIIDHVQVSSIIKALELISSETSNRDRLGWIKGHIEGCRDLSDWEDLLTILETGGLEQPQIDQLRTEALRWIKRPKPIFNTFGNPIARCMT
jgi:putative ATP-dependent endonuclease of OLD family